MYQGIYTSLGYRWGGPLCKTSFSKPKPSPGQTDATHNNTSHQGYEIQPRRK